MYIAVVVLTMLVLPAASVLLELTFSPGASAVAAIGRWFVFWSVGVRLALAGFRQIVQPGFTAREIFHMMDDDALPIVRELGIANLASATVALVAIFVPTFVLPAALYATIFYGVAGVRHAMERNRSANETIAMMSDLFIALVLLGYIAAAALG